MKHRKQEEHFKIFGATLFGGKKNLILSKQKIGLQRVVQSNHKIKWKLSSGSSGEDVFTCLITVQKHTHKTNAFLIASVKAQI